MRSRLRMARPTAPARSPRLGEPRNQRAATRLSRYCRHATREDYFDAAAHSHSPRSAQQRAPVEPTSFFCPHPCRLSLLSSQHTTSPRAQGLTKNPSASLCPENEQGRENVTDLPSGGLVAGR